ncbi:MAG: cbb3-type cytochrome oxidase subunit 3 [Casimicrobiaceae bacterium]
MIEALRVLFTVLSFLTFLLIVWWAWRPAYKKTSEAAMHDVLADDDRSARIQAVDHEVRK